MVFGQELRRSDMAVLGMMSGGRGDPPRLANGKLAHGAGNRHEALLSKDGVQARWKLLVVDDRRRGVSSRGVCTPVMVVVEVEA